MSLLRAVVLAALTVAAAAIKIDAFGDKVRPVTKVVKLLKGMQATMESEATEDEETYEKMTCWCKKNQEEKTKSTEEAQELIKSLTARVAELSATDSRLGVEIAKLKDEVAENERGLESATAMRKKQKSEFRVEEGELENSTEAVANAAATISSNSSSLLQMPKGQILGQLKAVVQKHKDLLTQAQLKRLDDFMEKSEPINSLGGIAGVLQGLRDDFNERLTTVRQQENRDNASYEDLRAAKRDEIAAGRKQYEAKIEQKAAAKLEMVEAKHGIKDSKAGSAADQELLAQVKERCGGMDTEYEKRRKMRSEELAAVAKAIAILDDDEARDSFGKAFGTSFLQVSSAGDQSKKAAALLAKAGKKDARLVTLSLMLKLDTFEKVKKAIDDLVLDMKKQQSDEVTKKDWCVDELNKNQLQTQDKNQEKASFVAKLETLKSSEAQIEDEMKALNSEVAEMEKQISLAGQNREKENKEFQKTIADQRQAQQQLKKALVVLKDYYSKPQASLLQKNDTHKSAPDFKNYKQSSGSVGVMSMLQQLVADAKAMEAEATHDEQSSQEDYEAFAKSTTAAIKAKNSTLLDKSEKKGQIEVAVVEAGESKAGAIAELKALSEKEAQVHGSCDFLLKSFEERQASRVDEMEALQQAKALLSGAKS
eukprot:TRINITY_DN16924_c1_g1_i1.p1 TRINITY_DN16924_c1_g1~~TRINITY_DN16924_c1_g1_i1.p1  ORF type:complete len:653 (+),score=228.02 TRINITY_DN16924_c1_g1_i1:76-2034(+)